MGTTTQLNTPLHNPQDTEPTEIEVTDPTHPLFGRRFPLLSISSAQQSEGFVLVAYRQYIALRIPIPATNLVPSRPRSQTKLTLAALSEFIELAEQCEMLCPTNLKKSGRACQQNSKAKSSTNSRQSSRR
jgi:hypothetical protein